MRLSGLNKFTVSNTGEGGRKASGLATPSGTTYGVTLYDGTASSTFLYNKVSVVGLDFTPRIVIISNASVNLGTAYFGEGFDGWGGKILTEYGVQYNRCFRTDTNFNVGPGYFNLPVYGTSDIKWEAYE